PVQTSASSRPFSNHNRGNYSWALTLPAWLAASKAALAASQDDHRETQRRISRLQEATKGLSIIDYTNHAENATASASGSSDIDRGRGKGKCGGCGATKDEGLAPEDGQCSAGESNGDQRHHCCQLHRMTLGVIGEVVSFLEPQAVLAYSMACKTADDVLRQDECWGGIFRVRHLKTAVDVSPPPPPPPASRLPASSGDSLPTPRGAAVRPPPEAPLRRAVIAHGRSLSRALCLFDAAVLDGGGTKAVINGPARTAAAVASLRALVEITANVSDPVGRKAFLGVRTGQMLLSIVTRQHGSAVLQASTLYAANADLACAVLGNLFCDPDETEMVESAGQLPEYDLTESRATDKLLGRRKGPAIQALSTLCSCTRPSPSWSTSKTGRGGMRPVENLPGRQASRALVNLLLPQYQVLQQRVMTQDNTADSRLKPIVRRSSLPDLPPTVPAVAIKCREGDRPDRGGYRGVGSTAAAAATAWGDNTGAAADARCAPRGREGEGQRRGQVGGAWEKQEGQVVAELTGLPSLAPAVGEVLPLLTVSPRKVEATGTTTTTTTTMAMSENKSSTSKQVLYFGEADESRRQPTTDSKMQSAPRPTLTVGTTVPDATVPQTTAVAGPHISETQAPIGALAAPLAPPTPATVVAASTAATGSTVVKAAAKSTFLHKYSARRSDPLPSGALASAPQTETVKYDGDCYSCEENKNSTEKMDSRSVARVYRPVECCSAARDGQQEETWEAFYFYHSGGRKDNFFVTMAFSTVCEEGFSGRGTDKLGHFVTKGSPLVGRGGDETWFITKTYTGRGLPETAGGGEGGGGGGGSWSGSAHVTHTAYLTDGLIRDKRGGGGSTSSSAVSSAAADDTISTRAFDGDHVAEGSTLETPLAQFPNVSSSNRHAGFWGVWEPVLGRAGGGGGSGGGGTSIATRSGDGAGTGIDRWSTTLSKRGGAFRFVPRG
ncbi:unnamed protein product, partial [Pylaiella littoralis]